MSENLKLEAEIKDANKGLDGVGLDDEKTADKEKAKLSQDFGLKSNPNLTPPESLVRALEAPHFLKHFILEAHKDCVFLDTVNSGKKDYAAAIWEVVDRVMVNSERSKR